MASKLDLVLNIDSSVSICYIMSSGLCWLHSITAQYWIPVALKKTFELIKKLLKRARKRTQNDIIPINLSVSLHSF